MPDNVTSGGGYLRFIKSRNEQVIADDEVEKIVESINAGRLTRSFRTHREHVKHVKSIVDEKLNSNLCPNCGAPMVVREIKKGLNQGKSFGDARIFLNAGGLTIKVWRFQIGLSLVFVGSD